MTKTTTTIRLLLVDDQPLFREAMRTLLQLESGLTVVAEAGDGIQACELDAAFSPDVVLMDLNMPRMCGTEATRRICAARPEARILVLTTFDHDQEVYEALRSGAAGYLLKNAPAATVVSAIDPKQLFLKRSSR